MRIVVRADLPVDALAVFDGAGHGLILLREQCVTAEHGAVGEFLIDHLLSLDDGGQLRICIPRGEGTRMLGRRHPWRGSRNGNSRAARARTSFAG